MSIITLYDETYKNLTQDFIDKACDEGSSGTFRKDKISLDNLDSESSLWIAIEDDIVVSISYAQRSIITNTPESIRICRYHILKDYRHGRYGFKFLEKQCIWAKEKNFSHIYWTHDINNKSLNALYQHKRTYPTGDNSFFKTKWYKSVILEKDILFKDSPNSDMLQYIYSIYLNNKYIWKPTKNIIKNDNL